MTQEHKDKLIKNRIDLIENIRMKSILSYLLKWEILRTRDYDEIKSRIDENENCVELFLDILKMKSDEVYLNFIEVLRQTGHEHIADLLEPSNSNICQATLTSNYLFPPLVLGSLICSLILGPLII